MPVHKGPAHKGHPAKGKPMPGKHKMAGGHMMADEDMEKMHKGKR